MPAGLLARWDVKSLEYTKMRLVTALRAFFRILFDPRIAADFERLAGPAPQEAAGETVVPPPSPKSPATPAVSAPARNEAITLLAALQREARFIDIVKEPLDGYSDAQIGAAARDVFRGCREVLDRFFAVQPVITDPEGAEMTVPSGFDTGRYHVSGNVPGEPPFVGQVVHQGWVASQCNLPKWSGRAESALVIAPVELEVK
jgi:hypothetical protein